MTSPSPLPFPDRVLFLVNPAAGGGAGRRLIPRLRSELGRLFPDPGQYFRVEETDDSDLAAQSAEACRSWPMIVAAGGDGTASRVIRGILDQGGGNLFGLIPLGTGNDLARSLGIYDPRLAGSPRRLLRAVQEVLTGPEQEIDIFTMDGVGPFCNYAGMGLDAKVLADYEACTRGRAWPLLRRSRALKFLLYGSLLVKNLGYALPPGIRLTLRRGDAEESLVTQHPCRGIIIGNTRTYAGGFRLHPEARMDDGLFEVILVRGLSDILRILPGRLPAFQNLPAGLLRRQARVLEWAAASGLPAQWDGERCPHPLPPSGSVRRAGRIRIRGV